MKNGNCRTLAGFVFIIAAILHLSRLITETALQYGSYDVPVWLSGLVGLLAAALAWDSLKK